MLEELGLPYELRFVDFAGGAHKTPAFLAKNPMGKLPVLEDGESVISESAAIGLYLADRYSLEGKPALRFAAEAPSGGAGGEPSPPDQRSLGTLAPALDDPRRGEYLRLSLFGASVIEPACLAHSMKWEYRPSNAGFGSFDDMMRSVHHAIGKGPWLFGDRFTMADVGFGATVRYMVRFKMMPGDDVINGYIARLNARPASIRADAKNAEVVAAHKLG
jgi:glutathione S-transferase